MDNGMQRKKNVPSHCTFALLFKDKKSKRSHKTVGIKVFLTYLLTMEVSGSGFRIQGAQKHTDPTDPDSDPQHWYRGWEAVNNCLSCVEECDKRGSAGSPHGPARGFQPLPAATDGE